MRMNALATQDDGPKPDIEALLRLPFGPRFVAGLRNSTCSKQLSSTDELIKSLVDLQVTIGAQRVREIFLKVTYK